MPGADAIAIGHSIRFADDHPKADIVGHETQHFYDIENVGALSFCVSYGIDYGFGRLQGMSHDEAYGDVNWEQRADYSDQACTLQRHQGRRVRVHRSQPGVYILAAQTLDVLLHPHLHRTVPTWAPRPPNDL